jgi:hypothetical protein
MELCRLASEECDADKLLDLVSEINRELDVQQNDARKKDAAFGVAQSRVGS